MNINGLPASAAALRGLHDASRPRLEQEHVGRTPAAPAPVAAVRDPLAVGQTQPALPVDAPTGTDPELWSVLSQEERVFFAKVGAMGPLTYGRMAAEMRTESAIPRGGRLDVKA